MSNPDKKIIIDSLLERVNSSPFLIVIDYTGLTVPQFGELRSRLDAAGAKAVVAKNSYVKKALAEAGLPDIAEELVGQTAFITGDSEVFAAAKVVKNFEKEFKKPEFKVGILDGAILTADKLKSIADIPSREAVLSQLLGLINEPATRIARVLNAKYNPEANEASEGEAEAE
ncbi:50S ribosomal protein L10 [Luteolibacter pohnpeiensis]|uniref:Large ribosomal subunit protein uL10 n=1 Tax=Luteolibacter pohnpeiensis TaxID=454153 RepID=A0A934S3D2_9BACT|nr:50S ribosomal protein L10 [Luteolibacter pohnpeiensis]MBK1881567.1 50S ribosomal protein L10 [Luteolibacter pohnpeiensis]